jgi:hypothetical protein
MVVPTTAFADKDFTVLVRSEHAPNVGDYAGAHSGSIDFKTAKKFTFDVAVEDMACDGRAVMGNFKIHFENGTTEMTNWMYDWNGPCVDGDKNYSGTIEYSARQIASVTPRVCTVFNGDTVDCQAYSDLGNPLN